MGSGGATSSAAAILDEARADRAREDAPQERLEAGHRRLRFAELGVRVEDLERPLVLH